MRKAVTTLIALIVVLALAAVVGIKAYAATPTIKVPNIRIPDISNSVRESVRTSYSDRIDWNSVVTKYNPFLRFVK